MSFRACSVCTLICQDPLQERCDACETILPQQDHKGFAAMASESVLIALSSDSENDDAQLAKVPRLNSCDSVKGALASSSFENMEKPSRADVIASHYSAAQQRFLSHDLVEPQQIHDIVLDEETVTFQMRGCDGDFNVFLSELYPLGESQIYGPDDLELSIAGTLEDILQIVVEDIRARLVKRCSSPTLDAEQGTPIEQNFSEHLADCGNGCRTPDSDDSQPEIMEEIRMEPALSSDIDEVTSLLGVDRVKYTQRADTWRIRLTIDLVDGMGHPLLDETTAKAWGVAADKPIVLEAQLPINNYMKKGSMPLKMFTSVWQEGYDKFQLEKQLLQILADFCDVVVHGNHPDVHASDADEVLAQYAKKKVHLMSEARVNRGSGLLVHTVKYLRLRMETLHEYCAICDQPFMVTPMFLRTVCTRQLCAYQFVEFGERITTAEGVNAHAEIADLLVCMFVRAVSSPRHELIVDPYPSVCADRSSKELSFNPEQKDFKKLEKTLSALMKIRDANAPRLGAAWTSLTAQMTNEGQALVQWIVASNRSYLAPLQENEAIQAFKTPFQYLLISAPPDREKKFQKLKAEHGSVFAFHGSGTENWHSILRNGLKNCSNTKYMTAGAAYGSGIYLAPDSHTSLGYSMRGVQGPPRASMKSQKRKLCIGNRFLEHMDTLFMLAVCEVVNHSCLSKHRNSQIWVMPKEEMVMTRFFIVFTDGNAGSNISITGLEGQIRACMEKLHVGCPGGSKPRG